MKGIGELMSELDEHVTDNVEGVTRFADEDGGGTILFLEFLPWRDSTKEILSCCCAIHDIPTMLFAGLLNCSWKASVRWPAMMTIDARCLELFRRSSELRFFGAMVVSVMHHR